MDNLDTEALEQIGQGAAVREDEENNQAQGVTPEMVMTDAQKWSAIPRVLGSVLCMAMPELKPAYSDDNCNNWGEAMVPLAEKYGWNPDTAVGPELGLVVVSLPMMVPTGLVIVQRRKAAREAAAKAAAERQTKDAGPPVAAPIAGDVKTPATNPDAQVFGTS